MNENLQKVKNIFRSQSLRAIFQWSRPAHLSIALISLIAVVSSLLSLAVTLVTKALIDGATGGDASALWIYGAALAALIAAGRALSVWSSYTRIKVNTTLQKHMQGLVTESILGKEYAYLKGFHSGELVNRVFSDVSVVKNGVKDMLPSFLNTGVSFVGAAVILIITVVLLRELIYSFRILFIGIVFHFIVVHFHFSFILKQTVSL